MAQAIKDVQTPDTPLVLKAQGSFFVGGEKADQTQGELGDLGPGGRITVNQMYVRYMVPQDGNGVPVVMVHGATLTGKSWETTPDGRMGWDEYFVRKGHPVYVPDQVGRGRSGFNQAVFNNVRAGSAAANSLPRWLRFSDEGVWPNFRFGLKPGEPFSDSQFPVTAVDELSKQGVPDVSFGGLPTPNPTHQGIGRPRRPGEWRRVDGAFAVGGVSSTGCAAESRRDERPCSRRAGQLPGDLHRRPDQDTGHRAAPGRVRRSPRHADRPSGVADLAGPFRDVSGPDRPHQDALAVRRRCSAPPRPASSAATAT